MAFVFLTPAGFIELDLPDLEGAVEAALGLVQSISV
jgi:hypothetical protein